MHLPLRPAAAALLLLLAMWALNFWVAPIHLWGAVNRFHDLFGDFLKVALTYPGSEAVHPSNAFGLGEAIRGYTTSTDYDRSGVILTDPDAARATLFHLTPLTTLLGLLAQRLMRITDPAWLYVVSALGVQAYLFVLAIKAGDTTRARVMLVLLALLSFPNVFMLIRGNLYAGLCSALILHALLDMPKRPLFAAVLLALACNIRPNAVLFVLPALALGWPIILRGAGVFLATGLAVFAAALVAAHVLWPDHTLSSFNAGLSVYHRLYVVGPDGIAGGSALFQPLKLLGAPALALCLTLTGLFGFQGVSAARQGNRANSAFLVCAAYASLSVVFGDYHLLVFLAPLFLSGGWIVALASVLILAPKAYSEWMGYPASVIINPVLIVLGALSMTIRTGSIRGRWRRLGRSE